MQASATESSTPASDGGVGQHVQPKHKDLSVHDWDVQYQKGKSPWQLSQVNPYVRARGVRYYLCTIPFLPHNW